jgi:hypothetical protein
MTSVRDDGSGDHRHENEEHPRRHSPSDDVSEAAQGRTKRRRVDDRRQQQENDHERVELELRHARDQRQSDSCS